MRSYIFFIQYDFVFFLNTHKKSSPSSFKKNRIVPPLYIPVMSMHEMSFLRVTQSLFGGPKRGSSSSAPRKDESPKRPRRNSDGEPPRSNQTIIDPDSQSARMLNEAMNRSPDTLDAIIERQFRTPEDQGTIFFYEYGVFVFIIIYLCCSLSQRFHPSMRTIRHRCGGRSERDRCAPLCGYMYTILAY